MSTPQRITLSRAKGWRMPENTVKVDRSTKWGNPYAVGIAGPMGVIANTKRHAWQLYIGLSSVNTLLQETAKAELRGKNLACWCRQPNAYSNDECHAAVLLKIANEL